MIAEDHKGRQPAHLAATRNHVKILRMLFDHGVDLDCQCEAGKTPLHYSAQHGGDHNQQTNYYLRLVLLPHCLDFGPIFFLKGQ